MQALKIIGLCIASDVGYGVLHDQVTAHVCIEYFTIGHPPVFDTDNPILLGFGWGVLATWWAGLLLGIPLAMVARMGARPKRSAPSLIRPIAGLLAVMAIAALVAGIVGWILASSGVVFLAGPITEQIPRQRQVAFLVDLWAHCASYLVGFVGAVVVMVLVWRARGREGAKLV